LVTAGAAGAEDAGGCPFILWEAECGAEGLMIWA